MSEEKTSRRIKLYTKTGDKMKTSLYDGSRVYKEDYIFDVLGTIDELNCHVGTLAYHAVEKHDLRVIQYRITNIASIIATPKRNKRLPEITEEDISALERLIDDCQQRSSPLDEFVLPGSCPVNCQAHICRVVARRVERMTSRLFHNGGQSFTSGNRTVLNKDLPKYKKRILVWFNRLSDFFFAYARCFGNKEMTVSELERKLSGMTVSSSESD